MTWVDVAPCGRLGAGVLFPSSFFACFEWCARELEAETLIGHYILLEKAMNMKIDGVIH